MSPVVRMTRTMVACFPSGQLVRELCRSLDLSEFVSLARQFACYQMSFFHSFVLLGHGSVYIVTVILTAVLCCL